MNLDFPDQLTPDRGAHFGAKKRVIVAFLNCFGILVTSSSGKLDANHIPFELDRSKGGLGILNCHVARKNPVWEELRDGDEVMVIFRADEA